MPISPTALDELAGLHTRVHACSRCFDAPGCAVAPDLVRVRRRLPEQLVGSEVMLVGEALGPGTQRLSGLPYVQPDGTLRPAGRTLNRFLATFGYTIRPDGPGQYAYSTDLVRCVPLSPPSREQLRPPTRQEAANCLPWLEEEVRLADPRVVVLLGLHAVRAVFREYLGRRVQHLGDIAGGPYPTGIGSVEVATFAVHHPSPLASRPERDAVYAQVGRKIAAIVSPPP